MSDAQSSNAVADFTLRTRSLGCQIGAIVASTLFLTLASYITIPMVPVPVSMQTYAVVLVGALFGWKRGGTAIAVWLAAGVIGLPVLADGAGGLEYVSGPTGGYLAAFLLMGILVGWLAERGWDGRRPLLMFAGALIAHALCLGLGAAWLAGFVGVSQAIAAGVMPFLAGAVLKSALAAASLAALGVLLRRFSRT